MTVAAGTAGSSIESFDVATGERLGAVPATPPEQVAAIVGDVAEVQPFWAQLPLSDRARYMRRAAQVILDNLDALARLVTREQGKPLTESYVAELLPTVDALHWIAARGERILRDERERYTHPFFLQKKSYLSFAPLGVIAVITPWNEPWSAPFVEAAVALMCGNGVVVKPSPLTPICGQRVEDVFKRAGMPEGVVRTVHGGADVGEALVEAGVSKVFFTGSREAGRSVALRCAERVKGAVLELGGNDPQIVLANAPLDHAVDGCVWGAFANAGQTCSGIRRVSVVRVVADRFVSGVVERTRALRVGDPQRWDTDVGPMLSAERRDRVAALVEEAVEQGATLHCGGPVESEGPAAYFAPAVLTGVRPEMRVVAEDVLGPVVPVVEVDTEEEAIRRANDSRFGLGASVWTLDRDKGRRIARRLEAATVWINDHMYSHGPLQLSWGGVKESGLGSVHSKFGFYECVDHKHVAWDPSRTRSPFWFPYDESLARAAEAAARLLHGRDADKRDALRAGAGPLARVVRRSLGRRH